MDWQEWYKWGQENSGFKKGDNVRVLGRAKSIKMGWDNGWVSPEMDLMIGKICEITQIGMGNTGISLDGSRLKFPFFVLELVGKAKEPTAIPPDVMEIIDKNNFGCSREAVIKLVAKIFEKINEKMDKKS
jgi:hypothetical protein